MTLLGIFFDILALVFKTNMWIDPQIPLLDKHSQEKSTIRLIKNLKLILRTTILEAEIQLMNPPLQINQKYFQQFQSLHHSRFLSFISFIVLKQTFICSYILWKKVISYLMLKEFNCLMLLCHFFSYSSYFFYFYLHRHK